MIQLTFDHGIVVIPKLGFHFVDIVFRETGYDAVYQCVDEDICVLDPADELLRQSRLPSRSEAKTIVFESGLHTGLVS